MSYQFYNPNPRHKRSVGDCSVRSIAKALNIPWESAYIDLSSEGFEVGDMPSSNATIDSYLRSKGFRKYVMPNDCPNCYTFNDFAEEHFRGTYLVCTGSHIATIVDSILWDSWDSSDEIVIYYYEREDWT